MNFDRMKEKKIRAGVICCVLWKQTGRKIFKKYPHKISATITAAPHHYAALNPVHTGCLTLKCFF